MTQDEIKQVIHYDVQTGVFRWRFSGKSHAGKKKPWSIAGTHHNKGYIEIAINRKRYLAHRLAWMYVYGEWPNQFIDHKNGNPLDNRIENLRDVSHKTNCENKRTIGTKNTSGYLGAGWREDRKKWRGVITVNRKQKFLGFFDTAELAHQAYLNAKREFHEGNTL
jgi:hypothetical protein